MITYCRLVYKMQRKTVSRLQLKTVLNSVSYYLASYNIAGYYQLLYFGCALTYSA